MPYFPAEKHAPIPTKDIASWIFDDPQYNQDMPIYLDAKDPSRCLSLNQARTLVRQLIAGFHAAGMKKGDCVCIHSFNDIHYPIFFLAIIAAGGVFAGTNPSYTPFELAHHMKTAQSTFLITEPEPEMLNNALSAAKECSIPKAKIWIFNPHGQKVPEGFKSWKSLLECGEMDWERFDDKKSCKETTAARLFSSGTTGLPKAAVLSHYNLIAQHTLVWANSRKPWQARRLLSLPMFHAACVPLSHTTVPKMGHIAYVQRRFELEPFLSYLTAYDINELCIVPPIAIAIIMTPLTKKYPLTSLKVVQIGAAPLGKESQARFKKLMGKGGSITQVWGMTEMSCIGSMFYYPEDDETGSVGRMVPGCDAKIINDEDEDITTYDTPGELCVRGPIVIEGYFNNPSANTSSFDSEGFFKTGDIVYCSRESGKWYIIDRKKELIKVRGFQVAPPELETVLLSHSGIVDAAVIGVKGWEKGEEGKGEEVERPRAYVVRREGVGEELGEEEVKRWCGEKLARYKELTGGVRFVESIPKNASGKILKRVLREEANRERETRAKL
ncbi:4-coumarate-CoA ligase-like protein [Tricladium varicosporioides]|nr:4-coumarate-CoA ligase-like protein [Hymenoscyphus varicosporioides]